MNFRVIFICARCICIWLVAGLNTIHWLCCLYCTSVSSNECSLSFFRDGVGTNRVGPISDGSSASFGSSAGSSPGTGSEQHLSTTCHPHNRSVLQSNYSTGETLPQSSTDTLFLVWPQATLLLHHNVSLELLLYTRTRRGEVRGWGAVPLNPNDICDCVLWYAWFWFVSGHKA